MNIELERFIKINKKFIEDLYIEIKEAIKIFDNDKEYYYRETKFKMSQYEELEICFSGDSISYNAIFNIRNEIYNFEYTNINGFHINQICITKETEKNNTMISFYQSFINPNDFVNTLLIDDFKNPQLFSFSPENQFSYNKDKTKLIPEDIINLMKEAFFFNDNKFDYVCDMFRLQYDIDFNINKKQTFNLENNSIIKLLTENNQNLKNKKSY